MMGVLGSEAELGCEVNERFGLTIDDEVRPGEHEYHDHRIIESMGLDDLDVCECRGKLAKRAGWDSEH